MKSICAFLIRKSSRTSGEAVETLKRPMVSTNCSCAINNLGYRCLSQFNSKWNNEKKSINNIKGSMLLASGDFLNCKIGLSGDKFHSRCW